MSVTISWAYAWWLTCLASIKDTDSSTVVTQAATIHRIYRSDSCWLQFGTTHIPINAIHQLHRPTHIKYLGQLIEKTSVHPDPDVCAIQEMKLPTNVKELSQFLGMINQLAE